MFCNSGRDEIIFTCDSNYKVEAVDLPVLLGSLCIGINMDCTFISCLVRAGVLMEDVHGIAVVVRINVFRL